MSMEIRQFKTEDGLTVSGMCVDGEAVSIRVDDEDGRSLSWGMSDRVIDAWCRNLEKIGQPYKPAV